MELLKFLACLAALGSAHAAPADALPKRQSGVQFTGVNVAGGEFGEKNIPGRLDKDYTWPSKSALDTLMSDGMDTFRVGMMMLVTLGYRFEKENGSLC